MTRPPICKGSLGLRAIIIVAVAGAFTAVAPSEIGPASAHAPTCQADDGLPDSRCTPGENDSSITPRNADRTICVPGWTAKVRPPSRVTNKIKAEREMAYGIPPPNPKPFKEEELDHLIPLALGGAPRAVANLWPEPADGELGYHRKDRLERALHRMVCAHKLGLGGARIAIASNWIVAYESYIGPIPGRPTGEVPSPPPVQPGIIHLPQDGLAKKDAVIAMMGAAAALGGLVLVFLASVIAAFQSLGLPTRDVRTRYQRLVHWIFGIFVISLTSVAINLVWLATSGGSVVYGVSIGVFCVDLVLFVGVAAYATFRVLLHS